MLVVWSNVGPHRRSFDVVRGYVHPSHGPTSKTTPVLLFSPYSSIAILSSSPASKSMDNYTLLRIYSAGLLGPPCLPGGQLTAPAWQQPFVCYIPLFSTTRAIGIDEIQRIRDSKLTTYAAMQCRDGRTRSLPSWKGWQSKANGRPKSIYGGKSR